jgi:hypothetical protein
MTRATAVSMPSKRLLTRAEAAGYCGMSLTSFDNICPVRPLALGPDKRLERYDLLALDRWIDRLANSETGSGKTKESRLAEF